MNIANVTQFVSFIDSNNLTILDTGLLQVVQCLHTYKSACDCYKNEQKQNIYNQCNAAYRNAVLEIVPRLKTQFLSKTPERQIAFHDDRGGVIAIISR